MVKGELWFWAALRWRAPKRELHGIETWAPLMECEDQKIAFSRVADAIELVKQYSPGRYLRLQRSFSSIVIWGTTSDTASYVCRSRMCRLWQSFILSPDVRTTYIASVLVHEATHGWLDGHGIQYSESVRHRIERVCVRAELLFCRRMPGAADEIMRAERRLPTLHAEQFTDAAFLTESQRALRELGCPSWLVRTVTWITKLRRRVASLRAAAQKAGRSP